MAKFCPLPEELCHISFYKEIHKILHGVTQNNDKRIERSI